MDNLIKRYFKIKQATMSLKGRVQALPRELGVLEGRLAELHEQQMIDELKEDDISEKHPGWSPERIDVGDVFEDTPTLQEMIEEKQAEINGTTIAIEVLEKEMKTVRKAILEKIPEMTHRE